MVVNSVHVESCLQFVILIKRIYHRSPMQTRNPSPRVNGVCRKRGIPRFRHYPLTRGLGILGLHWGSMFDYFSYL